MSKRLSYKQCMDLKYAVYQTVNTIDTHIVSHITSKMVVGAPVDVDDILGVGDYRTMENATMATRMMEEMKKFMFSK